MGRHLLRHVTVMAGAIAVLALLGLPWTTALTFGLLAGCMLMAFGMDHSGHSSTEERNTKAPAEEVHRH